MTDLIFNNHSKILNLTPFKVSISALISYFLKNSEINPSNSTNIDPLCNFLINSKKITIFKILNLLIKEYKCEISKKNFYEILYEIIQKILDENNKNNNLVTKEEIQVKAIHDYLTILLEKIYLDLTTINDIYVLFNIEIKELKSKNEEGVSLLENGGYLDNFIRKCLFAFYKLSFEDIFKLQEQLQAYISGEEIRIQLTEKEAEVLFERQMRELDRIGVEQKILNSFSCKHKYYYLARTGKMDESKE